MRGCPRLYIACSKKFQNVAPKMRPKNRPKSKMSIELPVRQCNGGDLVGCRGSSSLRLTHTQAAVSPQEAAFTSDSAVVLGAPIGWSHGILTCKACNKRDQCAEDVTTFLLGDQPGSLNYLVFGEKFVHRVPFTGWSTRMYTRFC